MIRADPTVDAGADDEPDTDRYSQRMKTGAEFVLDTPADLDPLWGVGDQVLWASGESLLLVGPTGVGKSTLAIQLLAGRLGLLDTVLGLPVKTADRPVLYLAMDRPRQLIRAMRRVFNEHHRQLIDELLVVWDRPLPLDLGRVPEQLIDIAIAAGAGTVFVDSVKDAAVKLTDDEVGGNVNRARQYAIAEGIELVELHHQRKGQGGSRPTSLEDVYGSTWITAGAGSVVLLWGAAGDPLVELLHLKQPAGEVGPLKIEHDHATGTSTVYPGQVDPLTALRHAPGGLTSTDLARLVSESERPTDNSRKKAQRMLERLVSEGLAHRVGDYQRGGSDGSAAARYVAVTDRPEQP